MRLAIIGYGSRTRGVLSELRAGCEQLDLVAITDVRNEQIRQTLRQEGLDPHRVRFFDDADTMLRSVEMDAVLIGTRCSLHAPMAIKVLRTGIPLYLEKPVAIDMPQWIGLYEAMRRSISYGGIVVVSFPLRASPLLKSVKEIVDSGVLGTIEHVQAVNNVPYGGVYFHRWLRDEAETGGLFLQKATHDFDYINYLLDGLRPVRVCAMVSKQIFKGDKPAGLMCRDCGEQETCPESPVNLWRAGEPVNGEYCGFAVDTGNEDSGSALVQYETGMHVSYTQNFFARKKAACRGATLLGYNGSLEFDWYTHEIKVFMRHTHEVESRKVEAPPSSHAGGDAALARNFIAVAQQEAQPSIAPLATGLLSALISIKARESARTGTFQQIDWPG
jgi:predicted dehydrogenase